MKVLVLALFVVSIGLTCNADSSEDGRRDKKGKKSASCQCGWRKHPQKRIVGGEESGINEWPMMAELIDTSGAKKEHMCGSTIISKRHVISAAHCFASPYDKIPGAQIRKRPEYVQVVVGSHIAAGPNELYIQLQNYIIHEKYDAEKVIYDVSIGIVENIPFSDTVGPACFPNSRLSVAGKDVYAVGWGYTFWDGDPTFKNITTTDVLRKVKLQAVAFEKCWKLLNLFYNNDPHQFCTNNKNASICPGDSGGPLLWHDPELNRYTLVGITSFVPSTGCGGLSGFVDTSAFVDWVKEKVQSIGESLCMKL